MRLALLPAPAQMPADEVLALRQDAYAQAAAIELENHRPADALKRAQEGLALGAKGDVFQAALLVAHGRASEALGHDADAAKDYAAAIRLDEALLGTDPDQGATP